GQKFGQALVQGAIHGLIGATIGGLVGGVTGGISAVIDKRNFWDGSKVQKIILAKYDNIPPVGQRGNNNCLAADAEWIDKTFGGKMTQEDIRNLVNPGSDPNTVPLLDADVWSRYAEETGHKFTFELRETSASQKLANILSKMQQGARIPMTISTPNGNHGVVMQSIVEKITTKLNGSVTSKLLYYVMDSSHGGSFVRMSAGDIINNLRNLFYILP
ncbi:MAG: hypothetical protein Q4A56_02430, partial [Porphyromonadaceae bacterium]|nr:hypothetical protein [Porphyromonadaceae bacterium]